MDSELLTREKNTKLHSNVKITPVKQLTCKNCGESFYWEKDLSKHRRLDCKKKPYGCPECGQLLSRRDSLRQHLQRHDGGKKYSCQFCHKMFDQQQNLKVHLRIHSGERPYKCAECGRAFNQSQNLTTHLRVHSGEKPYVCQECGATFRFCSGYRSHVLRSHSRDPLKRAKKRGRTKTTLPQVQHVPQESQVHRVSVIAKVSSSSLDGFSSIENVPSKHNSIQSLEGAVEIPSPLNAGLLTHSAKLASPQLRQLHFACQLCNHVAFRQTDIVQHMIIVHGLHQNGITKETNKVH